MKFILLLFIPLFCAGQKVTIETDDFTGATTVIANPYKGNKFKLSDNVAVEGSLLFTPSYHLSKDGGQAFAITITATPQQIISGCLSQSTGKIILLLEDKSTIECVQFSETVCRTNILGATYLPTPRRDLLDLCIGNFLILNYQKITKVRIYTTETYYDFEIKNSDQEFVQNQFKMVYTEAMKLSKK